MFDFVSASFCRGNSAGEQQRRAAMSCEGCAVKFTVFKRRRQCCICQRHYCTHCLQGGGSQSATSVLARLSEKQLKCAKCTVLTARPLSRSQLRQLRAKDLQLYLTSQKVSTHGCVEKDDLVNLLMRHAGGAQKSEPQSSQSHGYCQSGDQQASTSRNMGAEVTENRTTYATSETHSTPETPTTREMPEQQNSPEPTCHVSTSSSSSSLHSNPRSVGIDIVEVMDSSGEQSTSDSGPEPVIIIADEESSQADEVQAADAEEMAIEVEVEEVTDNAEEAMEVVEETEPIITTQCDEQKLGHSNVPNNPLGLLDFFLKMELSWINQDERAPYPRSI